MQDKACPVFDPDIIRSILGIEPHKSLTYTCTKCQSRTSGIENNLPNKARQCPGCSSILMHCPKCRECVSGTSKYMIIMCDKCQTDFVTDESIRRIHEREAHSAEIVLSGIRATGNLHLGNYLGALRQFVEFQHGNNECLFFVADLHTLTTADNSEKVRRNILSIATDYLAAGLDPERSIIYVQSSIPEIPELSLLLSMFQNQSTLEDLPTIKDLQKRGSMTLGKLTYPVLMAADILGPQATLVPVGLDQKSHIELARDLANRFNRKFGPTFTVPEVGVRSIKIPGLNGEKMGKSDGQSSIEMMDDAQTIARKYRKYGVTDPLKVRKNDAGNPDGCASVFPVYKHLLGHESSQVQTVSEGCRAGTRACSECKNELAALIHERIGPFQEARRSLAEKQNFVREVLHYGGIRARELIQPTLEKVRERLGIYRF